MKRILLSLMMLCGASSLCHAQEVKFEYDEAGNLVKRGIPNLVYRLDGTYRLNNFYSIKITPLSTNGVVNIRFFETKSGKVVDCNIQISVNTLVGTSTSPLYFSSTKGNFNVNISSIRDGYYSITVRAYVNNSQAPIQATIKYHKK